MNHLIAISIIAFILLGSQLAAQVDRTEKRQPNVEHALARIEKSLKELETMLVLDSESNALITAIRDKAAELKRHLAGESTKTEILFELTLVDLDAKGAAEAWKKHFGDLPADSRTLPEGCEKVLTTFPSVVAAPKLLVRDGQRAQMWISEDHEVQYLERIEGGHYVPRVTKIHDGIDIALHGSIAADETIEVEIEVDIARIAGKTEYAPDAPTVGLPLINRQSSRTKLELAPGHHVACLPGDRGRGQVVLIIRASTTRGALAPTELR